jgi:phosphatidylglycerophosphate synthase
MIIIPLYVLLIVFGVFLLTALIFALVNVGHLIKTGTLTAASFTATFLFGAYTVIVIGLTLSQLAGIDWTQPVTIWNNDWISLFTGLGEQTNF